MRRPLLAKIWTGVGVAAFIAAVLALTAGRFGLGAILLIVCAACLGVALRRHRRALRRQRD